MTATTSHPEHEALVRFGRGLLPAGECQIVEAHVATCDECTAQLTALDGDSLAQMLRQGPQLAVCPASTPMPSSLEGPTSPFTGLPSPAGRTPDDGPAAIPQPLRDHPRYRVVRLIGRGGMGNVYLAEHRHMGRPVALKVIDPSILDNPVAVRRFRQEVKAAARLSHANVVQAFDAEEAGGLHFLVLEYVEGQQLASYAAKAGPLPCQEACEFARQAALALQYAHDEGLVHRDVKPHNLMVTPDGRVKVLDFGLARVLARPGAEGASATQAGTLMGTPDYVAPEQARDAATADGRADVYSLGCTLYHLLTGQPPFPGETPIEKVARHLTEDVPALDASRLGLPAGLAEVVARMTARDPEKRYQTAGEVAAALAPFALLGSRPPEADRTAVAAQPVVAPGQGTLLAPTLPSGPRGGGRGPWRWAVALALLFFFGVVAAPGVVVYRIQTDNGELVIETVDDDVEVVVTKGGKLVKIYDPKSKQRLVLDSGTYELELKGKPTGLKLDLEKVTLKRGDKEIAKIVRVCTPPPPTPRKLQQFTKAGSFLAISSDRRQILTRNGKEVLVWDVSTGKRLRSFGEVRGSGEIFGVAFSPDGKRIVSGADCMVRVWDVASGKQVWSFAHQGRDYGWVTGVAFAPDGKTVFMSGDGGTIRQLDGENGREVRRFYAEKTILGCLAVSPDGRYVAGGASPHTLSPRQGIFVWEVASGKMIKEFGGHKSKMIKGADPDEFRGQLLFLPDGNRILSLGDDRSVRLWDVRTGKEVHRFEARTHFCETIGVSQDGRYFRTSGGDGMVRLWDLETGKVVQRFTDDGLENCEVSVDGRFAMFGGRDTVAHLWRLPDPPAPAPKAEAVKDKAEKKR